MFYIKKWRKKKTLDPTTLLQQILQSNTMHIKLQTNKKAWVWTWNNKEQQQLSCCIMIESCGPPMITSALLLLSPSLCLALSHSVLLSSITPIQEILEQSPMKNSHHSSPLIPSFVSFLFLLPPSLQPTQPTPKFFLAKWPIHPFAQKGVTLKEGIKGASFDHCCCCCCGSC